MNATNSLLQVERIGAVLRVTMQAAAQHATTCWRDPMVAPLCRRYSSMVTMLAAVTI